MATEIRPALEAPLRQASSRPAYYVEVHGVGHISFSDAPYVMPSTITRFGGDILTADRTRVVTSHILLTFLGAYLLGDTSSAMTDLSSTFSEVVVQRFDGSTLVRRVDARRAAFNGEAWVFYQGFDRRFDDDEESVASFDELIIPE